MVYHFFLAFGELHGKSRFPLDDYKGFTPNVCEE